MTATDLEARGDQKKHRQTSEGGILQCVPWGGGNEEEGPDEPDNKDNSHSIYEINPQLLSSPHSGVWNHIYHLSRQDH